MEEFTKQELELIIRNMRGVSDVEMSDILLKLRIRLSNFGAEKQESTLTPNCYEIKSIYDNGGRSRESEENKNIVENINWRHEHRSVTPLFLRRFTKLTYEQTKEIIAQNEKRERDSHSSLLLMLTTISDLL